MDERNQAIQLFGRVSEKYPGRTSSQAIAIMLEIDTLKRPSLITAFAKLHTDDDAIRKIVKTANARHRQTENPLVKNTPITTTMARGVLQLETRLMAMHATTPRHELEQLMEVLELQAEAKKLGTTLPISEPLMSRPKKRRRRR